ncbi:hypothetical protein HDU79_011223 [Rhizoclosmatium sp. JEL0117]|nr:hypothetical protein HDU79_011223 [Rhizoclosmatium sp. JEL0117]
MPNSESPTPVPQVEGKSCGRCVKQKRPCDSGRPACSRCVKAGLSSECSYLRDFKPRAVHRKPQSSSPNSPPLELEDPALMPTAQDFDLVFTWFTHKPATAENVTSLIDGTSFILGFALQPAPLRLAMLSVSRDDPAVILDLSRIKPLSAVPGTTLLPMESVAWECRILSVMAKIKAHLAMPPLNPMDLIVSTESITLSSELLSLQIPPRFILTTASGVLTPDEIAKFVNQLSDQEARGDATGTISVTLFYNAAICILHHPKILLMGFTPQMTYTPEHAMILSLSLDQAVTAAIEISIVCEFLLTPYAGPESRQNLDHWLIQLFTIVSMFQGLTTLWFITCRLPPHWLLGKEYTKDKLVQRAIMIAQTIHRVDSGYRPHGKPLEVLQPLVSTSEAMLKEMKKIVGREQPSPCSEEVALEDLVVSMKVLQVGETERMDSPMRQEPWSHLGMMGVELECGLRWYGCFELEWREFWSSLSLLT